MDQNNFHFWKQKRFNCVILPHRISKPSIYPPPSSQTYQERHTRQAEYRMGTNSPKVDKKSHQSKKKKKFRLFKERSRSPSSESHDKNRRHSKHSKHSKKSKKEDKSSKHSKDKKKEKHKHRHKHKDKDKHSKDSESSKSDLSIKKQNVKDIVDGEALQFYKNYVEDKVDALRTGAFPENYLGELREQRAEQSCVFIIVFVSSKKHELQEIFYCNYLFV